MDAGEGETSLGATDEETETTAWEDTGSGSEATDAGESESGEATDDSDSTDETGEPDLVEFQYPVGDGTTYPAGGWNVWQVMGHYWQPYAGRHLAQDIASADGGVASVDAPVYAVADGLVRYAGPNGSSYRNVVLIEHDLGEEGVICSFFGHVTAPVVETGEMVLRGDPVTSVLDWALAVDGGASSNTHLHYVLLSQELCDASAAANGALICGYDKGGPNAVETLDDEPFSYTAVDDICGDHAYADAFISPTQFIELHKP
jgi:murein DD-endopeptidase MepM/ murein hydrolase activator NlpD